MRLFPGVCRVVTMAAFAFGLVMASAEPTEARQSAPVLAEDGYVDCGGFDERPCTDVGDFHKSNGRYCDRGLKENDDHTKCVNDTRRQHRGELFAAGPIGRSLRMQRQDLNWNTSISRMSWMEAHNAYNNRADGYPFPNQDHSITEMLDAGIRKINLDVHYYIHKQADGSIKPEFVVPKLCHGPPCGALDRDFFNAIKEVSDWMLEDGHEKEIVTLGLEYRVQYIINEVVYEDIGGKLAKSAIDRYLTNDPKIGVLTQADIDAFQLNTPNAERGRYFPTGGHFLLAREMPSQQWLLDNHKRIIFTGGPYGISHATSEYSDGMYREAAGRFGVFFTNRQMDLSWQGFPHCLVGVYPSFEKLEPFPSQWWRLRPESNVEHAVFGDIDVSGYAREMTKNDLAHLAACNVDTIAFDNVLNDFDRLRGSVWSWAETQPLPLPNAVAMMMTSGQTSRWRSTSPLETRRFLCRKETRTTLSNSHLVFIENLPEVEWALSPQSGQFAAGHERCQELGDGWEFAPPQNANQNLYAAIDAVGAGVEPFINFRAMDALAERWAALVKPTFTINVPEIVAGEPAVFTVTATGFTAPTLTWKFRPFDAQAQVQPTRTATGLQTSQTFNSGGIVDVWVTVVDSKYGEWKTTIPLTLPVKPNPGPQIEFTPPSSPVSEGETVAFGFKANKSWPIKHWDISCGERTQLTAADLNRQDAQHQYWTIGCHYLGGVSHVATATVAAIHPVLGRVEGTVGVQVNNRPPDLTLPGIVNATLNVPAHAFSNLILNLIDAPGETLTVTIDWGSIGGFDTINGVAPGELRIPKFFDDPTVVGQPATATISVYDESPTPKTVTLTVIVAGQPPDGSVTGPARTSVGRRESIYFTTSDPDGGLPTHVTESCGGAARHVATGAEDKPNGTRQFTVRCEFTQVAVRNRITLTVIDDEKQTRQYEWFIDVGDQPAVTIEGPVAVDEGSTVEFHAVGTATDGDAVMFGAASCGSGTVINVAGDTAPGADLRVRFSCRFGDSPGPVSISATVQDVDGPTTAPPLAVAIRNVAPAITIFNGPVEIAPGQVVSLTGQAVDAGADSITVNVDWDDETADDVTLASNNTFATSHAWTKIGVYAVTLRAVDDEGASSADRTVVVTVFDNAPPTLTIDNVEVTGTDPAVTGAIAHFVTVANDNVGVAGIECTQASGSVFPFGVTTVSCTAVDAAGLTATASFTVTVRDGVAPVVAVPADMSGEAAGPNGTVVTFTATATDNVPGSLAATCTPASGSTFGIRTTQVTCQATDAAGNIGTASFNVTVEDTAAPTLSVADLTVTGSNPAVAGAVAAFSPIANDNVGIVRVECAPASGTLFPFGTTTVSCTAADAAGNTTPASFTVTVLDGVAPVVTVPADITSEAAGPAGTAVTFGASADDNVSGALAVTCTPASASTFGIRTTPVTCRATDAAGNTGTASFIVTVSDTMAPAVHYSGNALSYSVDQHIDIRCSATDGGSGIASSTCADITGPAYAFALGLNEYSATATDRSGNTGSAQTSFTINNSATTLQALVTQFSSKPDVTSGLNAKLSAAAKAPNANARAGQLGAFENQVRAQTGKALSPAHAAVLLRLAATLK